MKRFWSVAAALGLLLAATAPTSAQADYPDRTIRILVGFPAGGPPDIAARLLAERSPRAGASRSWWRTRPAAFPNISVVLQLIREGQLRALAVTSRQRTAATPDVPTMTEAGISGIDTDAWLGLMAPAGTPAPIVERLHRESVRILGQGDVRRRLDELGMSVVASSPSEFAALIQFDTARWAKVIKAAGIKPGD